MDKNLGEIKPRQKFGITNESSAYGKYKYKMAFAASCWGPYLPAPMV